MVVRSIDLKNIYDLIFILFVLSSQLFHLYLVNKCLIF